MQQLDLDRDWLATNHHASKNDDAVRVPLCLLLQCPESLGGIGKRLDVLDILQIQLGAQRSHYIVQTCHSLDLVGILVGSILLLAAAAAHHLSHFGL